MRLRNVKNKEEILNGSKILIINPEEYKGKWSEVFGNNNPIYVEIGMGKGKFIVENAETFKDINFIGIEKYDSVIARAVEKVDYIDNLRIVRMNADYIEDSFDHEIDQIFLNFSDPWPKKRHALRRLTSPVFLKKYDNIFKNDAKIIQKTDNKGLFAYSLESLSQYGYILEEVSLDLKNEEIFNITTEYEEKFMEKNQTINRLVAVKKRK